MKRIREIVVAAAAAVAMAVGTSASGLPPGELGNFVWLDEDPDGNGPELPNGVQDVGEAAVPGVRVDLYGAPPLSSGACDPVDANYVLVATQYTAANGEYYFTEATYPAGGGPTTEPLQPGWCYYMVFTIPDNTGDADPYNDYGFTDPNMGSNDEQDSDAVPVSALVGQTEKTYLALLFDPVTYAILGGEIDHTWDAGLVLPVPPDEFIPAELGNYVWYDCNHNGIQDEGPEWAVEGVTVNLFDTADLTAPLASTVTDATGFYSFPDLVPGTEYRVQFVLPSGYVVTAADQGADDELDSDAGTDGWTIGIVLDPGETDYSWDAGIYLSNVCTRTLGYWKTHPEAWPVDSIEVGGVVYSKADAIALMQTPPKGNRAISMFHQLVAAKLNVLVGNNSSCIEVVIAAADAWLAENAPQGGGKCGSAWDNGGSALHTQLDDYNNGLLDCAEHCDDGKPPGCDPKPDCNPKPDCSKDWNWSKNNDCNKGFTGKSYKSFGGSKSYKSHGGGKSYKSYGGGWGC